ncbi:hypothetical protein [Streptomyces sp. NPDC005438]|uniref:hypothetical protein n=1 Tax=Streptomyces sp. NPDC005438 TaxID=3156880 RepID=UPI0033B5AC21
MSRPRPLRRTQAEERDKPSGDDFAEFWAGRARTPETRARIRRLSRIDNISMGIMLTGMGLFVLMILVSIVLGIWFWIAGTSRSDVFLWGFGTALGVLLVGAVPEALVSSRLHAAQFADGDTTLGVIDAVTPVEVPQGSDGDSYPWFTLTVSAELPQQVVLRRSVDWWSNDGECRVGRPIRFRHNTLDPHDLHDVRFDGWPDETGGGRE